MYRTGPNPSDKWNTSWGWKGEWQRLHSPAVGYTPSPQPPRCRTRTEIVCSAAGEAALSIHRWLCCIPHRDLLVSPLQASVPSHQLCNQAILPLDASASPSSSQDKWSQTLPVLTCPLGHHVIFTSSLSTSGLYWSCVEWGEWIPAFLLSPSLYPSSLWLPLSISAPTPSLHIFSFFFPAHQLFSICISSPHESSHVKGTTSSSH